MSVRNRRARRIRRALLVCLVVFVIGVLVGSDCAEGSAEASIADVQLDQVAVLQEEVVWLPAINTAETSVEVILSDRESQIRRFLPDGHIEASVRVMGLVRAGISPFVIDSIEITGSLLEGVAIRLPDPVVTEVYPILDSCLWRHEHDLWAWSPDESALDLREGMMVSADSILRSAAEMSGLIEAARWSAASSVERLVHALGAERVTVSYGAAGPFVSSLTPELHTTHGGGPLPTNGGVLRKVAFAAMCIGAGILVVQKLTAGIPGHGMASPVGLSVRAAFVREARAIGQYNAADYHGSGFVRDSIPMKVLGIKVGQSSMWVTAPGTVHASVDLSGLTEADVSTTAEGTLRVSLPSPVISGCEIDRVHADIQRPACITLCGITAERVSGLENTLLSQAREVLIMQAVELGILERARDNTRTAMSELHSRISAGGSDGIEVVFSDSLGR